MKKKYGLIGKTLKHSFSKTYFEKKFADLKIEGEYENIEIDSIEKFHNAISRFEETVIPTGLNVTIPYKESIIPFLDELDFTAKNIGAVNCIQIKDGKKIGYNTDAFGFKQLIKPFFEAHHERAIILGTGGASKAVNFVLEELGVSVIFISRNPKGSNQLTCW